jgi:heat shock 70kDa protein 4
LMDILNVSSLSTTMNADEAVARGTALQSAILSPRFKVLAYTIVDYQPLPIKLTWDQEKGSSAEQGVEVEGDADGSDTPANSVVMFNRGLDFPIVRRVTLRRTGDFNVSCMYDPSATRFGLPVDSTHQITDWTIKAPPGDEKKIRVNVKEDIHGIISMSSVQMVEEIEDEEGEKDENGEKKKKSKRTNLEFTAVKPLDWSKAEVDKFQELEAQMENQDRIIRETANMRNSLESYIYDMRDKIISDAHLGPYATDSEKAAFTKLNDETESWLYEDGFDAIKSAFAAKLDELKKLGGPIEKRAEEAAARSPAVAALQKKMEDTKKWLADAQVNDAFAHITADEFSKCFSKCDEVSNWLYGMLDKQGSLPANVDPAFTASDVNSKSQELQNVCGPIMHKPKPKPVEVPKETPKTEEEKPTPMDTDEGENGGNGDKMEVDEA